MRQITFVLALAALTGAACASAPHRTYRIQLNSDQRGRPALYAQNQEFVCDYEMPTGSHISRTVCRSPRAMEAHRLASQELLQRWQMEALIKDPRTGGSQSQSFRTAQPAPR
ncbi:MAG TPA: hypothetical protein VFP65_18140 [Anaeromyxobacteraceae bacterium]|nr:hypothetical protein [Anaeromyxobacteraceae bacterium]